MFLTEGFFKNKGFIEPKGSRWVFFGIGSTPIDAHTLSGQTEGLSVGFKEWVGGFAKVDKRFGYEKWT